MTLDLIDKVVAEGAPLGLACGRLGLSLRTVPVCLLYTSRCV